MLERMWRNRNNFTLLVGVQLSSTIAEECGDSSRIWNQKYHSTPEDYKSFYYKDTCTRMLLLHYSQ